MTNKEKIYKSTPAQKEGILKKVFWGVIVVAVGIISAGRIDLSKNGPA